MDQDTNYDDNLTTQFPDVAAEWDYELNYPFEPIGFLPKSNRRVYWKCIKGHVWQARIADRTSGTGCPYCNRKLPIHGENDLETLFPNVSREWDYEKNSPLTPQQVLPHSTKKVWWICQEGHSWQANIDNRTRNKSGCPYCAGKRPIFGLNDLTTTHPELLVEWNYRSNKSILPQDFMACSNRKVWWMCRHGHEWQATIASRTKLNAGCPYCSGLLPIRGETDLESRNPYLTKQWDYARNFIPPTAVSEYSNKKVWWICEAGHSWRTSVCNRSKGDGCPFCHGKAKRSDL